MTVRLTLRFFIWLVFFAVIKTTLAAQTDFYVELPAASDAAIFAVQNSRALQIQRLEKLENIKLAAFSFRDFLPVLSLTYVESDGRVKNAPDSRQKSFQITLTQPVFDGGKKRLQYELNRINARFDYQLFQLTVKNFESEVIQLYSRYVLLKKITEIQSDVLEEAETRLTVIKREYELGLTLETDYLEYEIYCLELAWEKTKSDREYEKSARELKIILGLHENAELRVPDFTAQIVSYDMLFSLAPRLWNRLLQTNNDLRKKIINAEYQRKLVRFDQLRDIPNLSLQASLVFSGSQFPLTEPSFSLKCIISFNNRLFPSNVSSGLSGGMDGLTGVSSSLETTVLNSSTFFIERRLSALSLLAAQADIEDTEKQLKSTLYETLYRHDDLANDLRLKEQSGLLMQKRLSVNKLAADRGDYKHTDYLKDLIAFSQNVVERTEIAIQLETVRRSLEILLEIPFGGITNELFE